VCALRDGAESAESKELQDVETSGAMLAAVCSSLQVDSIQLLSGLRFETVLNYIYHSLLRLVGGVAY
jgi:hypothetical protein